MSDDTNQDTTAEFDAKIVEEPTKTEAGEVEEAEESSLQKDNEEEDWGKVALADDLSDNVFKDGEIAVGGGGFGDVYKGRWVAKPSSTSSFINRFNNISHLYDKPVAIKVIRPLLAEGPLREAVKRV